MVITYSDVCQDNVRKTWFGLGSSLYPHQFRFLFSVHHFALVSMPFSLSVGIPILGSLFCLQEILSPC